jgi:hypothetical protein
MDFKKIETLNFGRKRFSKFTGVEAQLKKLSLIALVLLTLGFMLHGLVAYIAYGLSAIALFFIFSIIRLRSGEEFKAYHYPLLINWSAASGAAVAAHDESFECKAHFFLAFSFEGMDERSSNQIIQMTQGDWFDAMYFFGCLNENKPLNDPSLQTFRTLTKQAQDSDPEKYRLMLLLVFIVYKFIGYGYARIYLMKLWHGELP